MAGGTWEAQNKILPGVYIRFKSSAQPAATQGNRGIVTICEPLSWGPEGEVTEVHPGDDMTDLTGYDYADPHNLFLQQIFTGTNRTDPPYRLLLYRPAGQGSTAASATITADTATLTVTAKYHGVRGNGISVSISASPDEEESSWVVETIVDGQVADSQTVSNAQSLAANRWVSFSGSGALPETAGTALTGGTDGTVGTASYAAYTEAISPYRFDIMIYDGTDATIRQSLQNFVEGLAADDGMYAQLVVSGAENPDSRFLINVSSAATLEDGTALTAAQTCWWVGGASAGARYNQSLTYAVYPGATGLSTLPTQQQLEQELLAGHFALFADEGAVKVVQDRNSQLTFGPDVNPILAKNRVMRLCNTIANDLYRQFSTGYIGVVDNTEDGRTRFRAAVVGYLLDIQAGNGIQNFTADDVEVLPGDSIEAILINIAIRPVDSVEKIYMTIDIA